MSDDFTILNGINTSHGVVPAAVTATCCSIVEADLIEATTQALAAVDLPAVPNATRGAAVPRPAG